MVHENQVTEVVVGLPLSLAGGRGAAADHAEKFGRALQDLLNVPVTMQDERLTTVEAERALRRAGVRGPDRRDVVDQHAAVLILQAFLDRSRPGG
jgi:putative Holliday junction resolvase